MLLSARINARPTRRPPAAASVLAALTAAAAATAGVIAAIPGDPRAAARRIFAEALRGADIAAIAWRDGERPERRVPGAAFVLALCPLEGADDLEGGMPAGTLFSLRPAGPDPEAAFLAPGRTQVAAGFVVYGPRTLLTLTDGTATTTRILDPQSGAFRPPAALRVPQAARRGGEAPRGADGGQAGASPACASPACTCLAAGAQRVLTRGGLHLRPADPRPDAGIRLVHEAAPIALAIEAAGGAATDGRGRAILDLAAGNLDRCTPLAIGPAREVADLARRLEADRDAGGSPLFASRGLLRA
ncbi:fructose-bisphosphatase [Methylobacterium frigidaeris]|uniref:Fructose-1,6-bisphosphatase class 1 n=1 Tax=Methylobacterium frigidaeris TaxID=2038277 RepID=A0AA37H8F1_9HYPH|nr:fructose-bisphosphatase [Methylobacterium frigidaeris]PIK68737.1 fructose-bisphosphatase [Methylobacterium frigidaeris]GJD61157.1 Fructose-1,6-bisphosphatase class 1 [Methylobacterium frigidaeris]